MWNESSANLPQSGKKACARHRSRNEKTWMRMDLASVRLTVDLTACSAARHANAGPHPCQDSPGLRGQLPVPLEETDHEESGPAGGRVVRVFGFRSAGVCAKQQYSQPDLVGEIPEFAAERLFTRRRGHQFP